MKKNTLLNKTMKELAIAIITLMLLAVPLFYMLTRYYYAEDLIDIIESIQRGNPLPAIDIEEDIVLGMLLQFVFISLLIGAGIIFTMHFLAQRMWHPFDKTLHIIEAFRLEQGFLPALPETNIQEFDRLNTALSRLMENCLTSYRVQKEFTENASHELQTPLAIIQSKLDVFAQQSTLTSEQAASIQSLYEVTTRLSRLNRNLLLLARIDNQQYANKERIDFAALLKQQLPLLESLTTGISLHTNISSESIYIYANPSLMEVLINNLVVNAVRYNIPDGDIFIHAQGNLFSVSNTSSLPALNADHIFARFYHPQGTSSGNGLGLAIAKAVCDYHGYALTYHYADKKHLFEIKMNVQANEATR